MWFLESHVVLSHWKRDVLGVFTNGSKDSGVISCVDIYLLEVLEKSIKREKNKWGF